MGIEIHRAPDRDVRRDDAVPAARPLVLPAPLQPIEEELETADGLVDVARLHAELADLRDFTGIVHRGGRVFATFAAMPSRGAVGLARARAKAHRGRP